MLAIHQRGLLHYLESRDVQRCRGGASDWLVPDPLVEGSQKGSDTFAPKKCRLLSWLGSWMRTGYLL